LLAYRGYCIFAAVRYGLTSLVLEEAMTIHLGYYSLVGFAAGVLLPILIATVIWSWHLLALHRYIARERTPGDEVAELRRSAFVTMMQGQYYPFWGLQPLHWALPWVMLLTIFTVPAGVMLDNGFVVGWFTLLAAVLVFAACWVSAKFIDEYNLLHPLWWQTDFALIVYFWVALLCGSLADTWLL
jgi:hypothetical protein